MKTILVIDNDNTLRENVCDFLKGEGYNVLSAHDGIMGLQQAISHLPNLILCEIIMPGMNGYDFYKTIQQLKPTSTIPLIFVTAQSEKEDFRAGMNLGVDDYITKPFDYNELLYSIKTRFDKSEKLQQNNDEKFCTLINNPLTGVFIYSKNKFDFVNEKCAKIFGLSPDDFSNMTFNNLITGSDKRIVLKKIECCFSKAHSTLHTCFQAYYSKGKHKVVIEMYAGFVNFRGVDSLVGYMSGHTGVNSSMPFLKN
jgi:PAS domain S-box-containing protein